MINNGTYVLQRLPTYRWYVLLMGTIVKIYFYMGLQLVAAFGVAISSDYGINNTQLGFLITSAFVGYTLFSYYGGALTEIIGKRNTITIGLILETVFTLCWPLVHSYPALLIVRFMQGLSGGMMVAPDLAIVSSWFPRKERGIAEGILLGGLGFGSAIVTSLAPILLKIGIDWQMGAVLVVGLPGIIVGALWALTVKDVNQVYSGVSNIDDILPQQQKESAELKEIETGDYRPPEVWSDAIRNKRFWWSVLTIFCICWVVYGMGAFVPQLLAVDLKLPADKIASWSLVTFAAGLVTTPLGGILSDKILGSKRYPVIVLGFALCFIFCLVLPKTGLTWMPLVLFCTYGSIHLVNGPFWSLPGEVCAPSLAARTAGFWLFLGLIGGILVTPVMGYFVDIYGTNMVALYSFALFSVIGLVCSLGIKV